MQAIASTDTDPGRGVFNRMPPEFYGGSMDGEEFSIYSVHRVITGRPELI